MSRFLNRLAPVALLLIAALGAPACAAPTDAAAAADSADVAVDMGAAQIKVVTIDGADLAQEAANLDRISSELRSATARVDAVSREVTSRLSGPSGTAAQAARVRFGEAATRMLREVDGGNEALASSGGKYAHDEEDLGRGGSMGFLAAQFDFGAIDASLSEIQGSTAQIASLLEEGRASLARLASVWGGAGSESYSAVQTRWDGSAMELNASVRNLASVLSTAVDSMSQTDRQAAGLFAG